MAKPIIAVTGATGFQGGSVVRFLMNDGKYAIRAITRDPNSEKAKALSTKYPGIEIVKASLDDPSSLRSALKGAYGVFGVTNYWEHGDDAETKQGVNLVDAAKEAGVKHFVWSTLDNGDPSVPHWVSKWRVDEHLKASGVPRTSLYTAFYLENVTSFVKPSKVGEDTYLLPISILPDEPIFTYPARDTGAWVVAALNDPDRWINKDLRVVTEWLTTRQMAETMSKVTGKTVLHMDLDQAGFERTKDGDYPGAAELYLNLLFFIKVARVLYGETLMVAWSRQWNQGSKNDVGIVP